MTFSDLKRSPVFSVAALGAAFLCIVVLVFLFRSDEGTEQATITPLESAPVEPSADNVDPAFHSRLMVLEREVEESPTDTTKLLELAHLHQDAHQMAEAAEAYEQLLEVVPDHRQAYLDLALCYTEVGRLEDAQTTTDALLERYPNDPAGLYNLGAIHANQEQYREAREIWGRVQTQTEDAQLAAQATASLAQLEALAERPSSQQVEPPAVLPTDHPPIPLSDYEPVIAGQ